MDIPSPVIIHTSLESGSSTDSFTSIPLPSTHLARLQPTELPNAPSSNLTQPNQYLSPTSPSFPSFPSNQLTPSSQFSSPSNLAHARTPSPSYSQSTRESRMGSPYTPSRSGEGGSRQGSATKVRRESDGDGEELKHDQEREVGAPKLSFKPGFLSIPNLPSPTPVSPASTGTPDTADDIKDYGFLPHGDSAVVSRGESGMKDVKDIKVPGEEVPPRSGVQSPARTHSSGSGRTVLSDDSEKTIVPGTATGLRNALANGSASWTNTSPRPGSASHPNVSISPGSTSSSPRKRHRPLPLNLSRKASQVPDDGFDQAMISPSPVSGRGAWKAGSGSKTAFFRDRTKDESEPGTAISFGSSDAGSEGMTSDLQKLDLLGKTVRQNLRQRPVDGVETISSASPSAASSASSPVIPEAGSHSQSAATSHSIPQDPRGTAPQASKRLRDQEVDSRELLDLLQETASPTTAFKRRRLLILDARPMPAYLVSHLVYSAKVVIPSMILTRCKNSGGEKWQGGWETLRGFISTEGGRTAWDAAFAEDTDRRQKTELTMVIVGEGGSVDDKAETVDFLTRTLAKQPSTHHIDITVKWVAGGWAGSVNPFEALKEWYREGERSIPRSYTHSRIPLNTAYSRGSSADESGTDAPLVATPSVSLTASPGIFHDNVGLPPVVESMAQHSKPPMHHPSMPALRLQPASHEYAPPPLISPGFNASRSGKRQPPRPSPINTTGLGRRSNSAAAAELSSISEPGCPARPPKPSLNTGGVPPLPLKSASVGNPSPWMGHLHTSPRKGRQRGPGLSLDILDQEDHAPFPSSRYAPPMTSLDATFIPQTTVPPSPNSFGGITRRIRQSSTTPTTPFGLTARPELMPSQPSTSYIYSPNMATAYAGSSAYSPVDDERGDSQRDSAPFVVSTILPSFLYLGPEITTESDVQQLLALGVKRILNVAVECNDAEALGIKERFEKYVQLPLRDCVEETGIGKGVRDACTFLDDARLHSAPTYVHCKAGKSRSVTAVLAYLIHANAWTLKTAYAYVAERRKGISPNIGFVAELMQYEESELGLKASSGVIEHDVAEPNEAEMSPRGSGRNKYARESLPPTWSSSLDTSATANKLTIGMDTSDRSAGRISSTETTPRAGVSERTGDMDSAKRAAGIGQSGTEKEVRRDGQYVHFRRAPVDEYTLQPMRRVSKAGLESLRALASPHPSPSLNRDTAKTPAIERHGWL